MSTHHSREEEQQERVIAIHELLGRYELEVGHRPSCVYASPEFLKPFAGEGKEVTEMAVNGTPVVVSERFAPKNGIAAHAPTK